MVSEIKSPGSGVVTTLASQTAKLDRTVAPTSTVASASADDGVKLTGLATRLQALTQSVAEVPQVDQARVDAVRQTLADGKYQIEPNTVADKLLAFEGMLGNKG